MHDYNRNAFTGLCVTLKKKNRCLKKTSGIPLGKKFMPVIAIMIQEPSNTFSILKDHLEALDINLIYSSEFHF